jgi:SAM-dependent methyltransferase
MKEDKEIKLDIGCGLRKFEGFIGIDSRKQPGVDVVMNVELDPLPYKVDTVDEIRAYHVFEHLRPEGLFHLLDECGRVLKPTGLLNVEVPRWGTPAYLINPDHKIGFVEDTFGFFQVPADGMDAHGYLKHFWHVQINKCDNPEAINVTLYPNKPGGKFPHVKIKPLIVSKKV